MKNEQEEKAFCDFLVALGLNLYELDDDSFVATPKIKAKGQPGFMVDFTKSLEVNVQNFISWRRAYLLRTEIYKKSDSMSSLGRSMGIRPRNVAPFLSGEKMRPATVARFAAALDVAPEDLGY